MLGLCVFFSWAKLGHCSHSFQCAGEGAAEGAGAFDGKE